MQALSSVIPLTHGIEAARQLADGATLSETAGLLATEAGIGLAYLAAGVVLLRLLEYEGRRSATRSRPSRPGRRAVRRARDLSSVALAVEVIEIAWWDRRAPSSLPPVLFLSTCRAHWPLPSTSRPAAAVDRPRDHRAGNSIAALLARAAVGHVLVG